MLISKRALTAFAGLLLTAASAQAQTAPKPATTTVPAASSAADARSHSLLGIIAPALTDPVEHRPQKACDGKLYSSHDVVGDPESCFMGRLDVRGGMTSGSSAAF